jgi:hypothetical protein
MEFYHLSIYLGLVLTLSKLLSSLEYARQLFFLNREGCKHPKSIQLIDNLQSELHTPAGGVGRWPQMLGNYVRELPCK